MSHEARHPAFEPINGEFTIFDFSHEKPEVIDLDRVVSAFDPSKGHGEIRVGHEPKTTSTPFLGQLASIRREGNSLKGRLREPIPPALLEHVKSGRYTKRSAAFRRATMELDHVALLGAWPPACKALPELAAFSDEIKTEDGLDLIRFSQAVLESPSGAAQPARPVIGNGRVISLIGEIAASSVQATIQAIQQLATDSATEPITIHLDSPGGEVYQGLTLGRWLSAFKTPIRIINTGMVASSALTVFLGAAERLAMPGAAFMMHGPKQFNGWGASGPDEAKGRSEELDRIRGELAAFYAERTGRPVESFMTAFMGERYVPADRAMSEGIVTRVMQTGEAVFADSITPRETTSMEDKGKPEVTEAIDLEKKLAEFAAKEAERDKAIAERDKRIEELERAHREKDFAAFADELISGGKFPSNVRANVVATLEAVHSRSDLIAFAGDGNTAPINSVEAVKRLLSSAITVQALKPGRVIDNKGAIPSGENPIIKMAEEFMKKDPTLDYAEAVIRASASITRV